MFKLTFDVSADDLHGAAYLASQVAGAAKGLRHLLAEDEDFGCAVDLLLTFVEQASRAISDAAELAARTQTQAQQE